MAAKKTSTSKATKKAPPAKAAPAKSGKAKPATKANAKAVAKAAPPPKAKPVAKAAPPPKGKPAAKTAPPPKAKPTAAPKTKPANAVVHWEIQSQQPETLHRFYGEVFGWKIDADNPMKYGMVASKGAAGIDGGIGGTPDSASRVVVYASVPSIVPVLKRIEDRGGKTLMPRTDIGPVVMALYLDPEGNTMGLIEPRD
jgi:predicted enzyme related to lactoylglutathione lyase